MSREFLEEVFGTKFTDERPLKSDSSYLTVREDGSLDARVSYLDFNFEPKIKGEILVRGSTYPSYEGRRDWWVVEYPHGVLKFRLCSAMEGSGYDAFAVADYVDNNRPRQEYKNTRNHFVDHAGRMIEYESG